MPRAGPCLESLVSNRREHHDRFVGAACGGRRLGLLAYSTGDRLGLPQVGILLRGHRQQLDRRIHGRTCSISAISQYLRRGWTTITMSASTMASAVDRSGAWSNPSSTAAFAVIWLILLWMYRTKTFIRFNRVVGGNATDDGYASRPLSTPHGARRLFDCQKEHHGRRSGRRLLMLDCQKETSWARRSGRGGSVVPPCHQVGWFPQASVGRSAGRDGAPQATIVSTSGLAGGSACARVEPPHREDQCHIADRGRPAGRRRAADSRQRRARRARPAE